MYSHAPQPRFLPPANGLYDPEFEHDNCGVGFVANINRQRTHQVIQYAGEILENLRHRGAIGGDGKTGDGAGILLQISHPFFQKVCDAASIALGAAGEYGIGQVFLPLENVAARKAILETLNEALANEGLETLGWRQVPTDDSDLGYLARDCQPWVGQIFLKLKDAPKGAFDPAAFERRLYIARKMCDKAVAAIRNQIGEKAYQDFYICTLSSKTICYKGMLVDRQVMEYYKDLRDPDMVSALAIVHQRYSTNTFPSWSLAQPFRYIAHNGEINTLRGNVNKMKAREAIMESEQFGDELDKLFPIIEEGVSDSACFDNALELLYQSGRSAPHALMMMIPEAWGPKHHMSADKRAFYEYHSAFMEPWDGPAAMVFTDGALIGGALDRNGLRPCRYTETKDGYVVLASETGVLHIEPANVRRKGRLMPGRMLLVDTAEGRIVSDSEVKNRITRSQPYRRWLADHQIHLHNFFAASEPVQPDRESIRLRQKVFGYTREELRMILTPMARNGQEAVGSMGDDTPLAVLSDRPQLLYRYFKQLFAQVTNPPIDPLREELVMSLRDYIGRGVNLLTERPEHARMLSTLHPILSNDDMHRIKSCDRSVFHVETLPMVFDASHGADGLKEALDRLLERGSKAIRSGAEVLILTDREVSKERAPIPALLAVASLQHRLIRDGRGTRGSIIVETGEAREIMHFATLIGYGACAINPYLAFETLTDMRSEGRFDDIDDDQTLADNYIKAIKKGLLKTLSRMGISTLRSYRGAQIFEAVGLGAEVVNKYFVGTPSRLGGIGLSGIAEETLRRHRHAFATENDMLDSGGAYHVRNDGERHLMNGDVIHHLMHAARTGSQASYDTFARLIDEREKNSATLRSQFRLKKVAPPVPLEEVEPASEIVKRFATGAMSFGSISKEAHECLAIAMNRIGAMSNTGEGGEEPERFKPRPNGDSACSKIKQVASGRFGVTNEYLANAQEIQIKMAQGAKPGEGGQLPGFKVNDIIAKTRHSTPGVSLISPPPHHDIYSIEDLAQLIFDLKNANPSARISVKLVSEAGVGTVAAGVAKAKADMVLIAGHDGGTGASPLTSIKYAGMPWEIGLAETQQALVANHLRNRIRVQTDGQLRTGRDVIIAALLGAEEYGFATVALATMGCCLLRKCHLNSCTMGIATQNEKLRSRFQGRPEHVINYFMFVAEHTRQLLAELGFRSIDEIVGRSYLIEAAKTDHWKARYLDFSKLLQPAEPHEQGSRIQVDPQDHQIDDVLDRQLIKIAAPALKKGKAVEGDFEIHNYDRATGTMLSYEIARRYGFKGLPEDTIQFRFTGAAGQSFGAFAAHGLTMRVEGDTNDYLGKGLSGGKLVVVPPREATFEAHENIITGNTVLYGAISGEIYIRGMAGERFAVRNSGARAVVEGLGDHGCEYMTGGIIVCLGRAGRNFAAGMSGGFAYVLDEDELFDTRCNLDMVNLLPVTEPADVAELRNMIERHVAHTDSTLGKTILERWDDVLHRFLKVAPIEYTKALEQMRQRELRDAETTASTEEVYTNA